MTLGTSLVVLPTLMRLRSSGTERDLEPVIVGRPARNGAAVPASNPENAPAT